jgi:hypothetical protein
MTKLFQYFPDKPPEQIENLEITGTIVVSKVVIDTIANLSGDGTVYSGIGKNIESQFKIETNSLIAGFSTDQYVKVFGVTEFDDNVDPPEPDISNTSFSKTGSGSGFTYYYWVSQYHLRNGKIGISSQISPSGGVNHIGLDDFNLDNHVTLTIARQDTNHGILVYRQKFTGVGTVGDANVEDAKLTAILGPKELSGNTSNIIWKDYGNFDQTAWSPKGTDNEFKSGQIHFPNTPPTTNLRGWDIAKITDVNSTSITLDRPLKTNIGIGTTNAVKFVHDNTNEFEKSINKLISDQTRSLSLPAGTYLTNTFTIPSNFTLSGLGNNTVIKQQYFATDINDGTSTTLNFEGNVVGLGTTSGENVTIDNITFDGNNENNIVYESSLDNYILYFPNLEKSTISNVRVRNSPADGIYLDNSNRVNIDNISITDGSLSDREVYTPLYTQSSTILRINNSIFENFSGPVDVSASTIVSLVGNVVRNCGTGLKTFGVDKIRSSDNIILGPADEYIPTTDIYDSDFDSVNLNIERGVDFYGPVIQYLEDGEPKDISSTKVAFTSLGISTFINENQNDERLSDTSEVNFEVITPDTGDSGRQNGYLQLKLTAAKTNQLGLDKSYGYQIRAKEFIDIVPGFTTSFSIEQGIFNVTGVGATQYTVTLKNINDFSGISTGDVVKLVNHNSTPSLEATELTVSNKVIDSSLVKKLVLTGFTTTSISGGGETGYIVLRKIFTIAKGRVGVS